MKKCAVQREKKTITYSSQKSICYSCLWSEVIDVCFHATLRNSPIAENHEVRSVCVCTPKPQRNLAGSVGTPQESLPFVSGSDCGEPQIVSLPGDLSCSGSLTNGENRIHTDSSDGD